MATFENLTMEELMILAKLRNKNGYENCLENNLKVVLQHHMHLNPL